MKRFFAFVCALSLIFSCFPATVFATAEETAVSDVNLVTVKAETKELFPDLQPKKQMFMSSNVSLEDELSDEFMDYLRTHFGNCETQFDISEFNIPYSRLDYLRTVIWFEMPELFNVYSLGCTYNSSTNMIAEILVTYYPYADTAAEYLSCLDKMLDGAEYLLQGIRNNDELSDVEKALLLHDRLAVWTEYDIAGSELMDPCSPIFGAYSALGEGLSVCQGYSMAYMYLLDQVGIESDLCSSNQICHAWNIVYIDGVAYHVDVTWDDPITSNGAFNDVYGRVLHDNFLLSTDGIWSTGHKAYDYNTAPKDSRYDSENTTTWWMKSDTAIQLIDNKLYYQNAYSGDVIDSDNGDVIHTHEYDYASYTLSSSDGMLLCASSEDVHTVDPKTGVSSVVYTPESGNIVGMKYEMSKLHIQLTDDYGNSWRERVDYIAPEIPEASVDYTYTVENGEATITGYTGAGGDIVLPCALEGYPVTAIADYAFREIETLTSVVMPDSVTAIGTSAFSNCTKLENVVISNNVSILNRATFSGCKELKSVTLGAGLLTIDSWAFSQCESLVTIELGGKIKKVGMYAFERCKKIETVTIGESISEIGDYAFQNCENLTTLNFNAARCSFGTSTFEGGENKPVFVNCCALSNVIIGSGVKTIPRCFIYDCDAVKSIELPEGIVVIYDYAFSGCNGLTTVTIPKSLTSIGTDSFYNCTNIRTVYYGGTTEESKDVYYFSGNEALLNATWICTDPHQHNYARKITNPTCTAKGYTTYTCACGDKYKANYTNALGHSYKSGSCTRCKYKPTGVKITTQPVNVAVASGKTAKVTIKATGTGLKYNWYYAKKGAKTYAKATSTANSYSLKMSSSYDGTKVYCVVSDSYGNSVKSSVVTLYKGTPAKITTQPKSVTVANGKTGKLKIKASGSSLKYQWYVKYKGATAFTKVGASSKTYSFKMASKLNGAQAYCVVKDKYGIEIKSSVVTIKMPAQPKVTTQPKSITQVSGKTVKFSVKASGEGLKYQWYYAKKGSNSFKKLSGATKATYSLKVSSSVNGRKYYCLVTDKYGQTVKSSAVTLTLKTVAKITTQPKSVTVKNGSTAKVTIKAVGDGLKYTWYYLKPGATKYTKASATGTSYSVKMSAAWKNAKVYCVISDKYGNTVKSSVVTLKMK